MRARGLGVVGAAVVACAAAAACIPSRDNPNDPQNAPVAHLVFDSLPQGSSCQTDTGWTQVWSSSRGRCVALDARATVDPRNRPLSALRFTWFYLTPIAGAPPQRTVLSSGADFTIAAPGLAVLTPALLHKVTPNRTITFGVDADAGEAQAALLVQNSAPTAIADPLRILPLGGYPWEAPAPFQVSFTAGIHDADDDPMISSRWTWRDPVSGAAMQSTASTISLSFDETAERDFHASLEVSDGAAWSFPVDAELRITAGGVVWTGFDGPSATPAYVERLDTLHRLLSLAPPATTGSEDWFATYVDGPTPRFAFLGTNVPVSDEIVLATWPDGTPVGAKTVLASNIRDGRIEGDPAAPGALWVLEFADFGAPSAEVWHEQLDGTATSLSNDGTIAPLTTTAVPSQLRVDAAGTAWVALSGSAALAVVQPGVQSASWAYATGPVIALDARPTDPSATVWALVSSAGSFALDAFDASSSSPLLHVAAPLTSPHAMAFAGVDELWIADADGVRLVDVPSLLAGAGAEAPFALDDATRFEVSVNEVITGLLGDPLRGSVWGVTSGQPPTTVRVDADGTVQTYGVSGTPQFIDPFGRLWLGPATPAFPQPPQVSEEPDQSGVVVRLPRGAPTRALVDSLGGGVWRSEAPDTITLRAADGRLVRTLSLPGASFSTVELAPDAAFAWRSGPVGTPVHRFDLASGVETPVGGVFTPPAGSTLGPACGAAVAGTQPSSSFVWLLTSAGAAETVTSTGLVATHGTIPVGELTQPVFSRSLHTNAVCLTTQDASSNNYLWYFTPSGSGVTTPIVTLAKQFRDLATGLDASGNDLCWVTTFTAGATCSGNSITVTAYSSAGATVHTYTDSGVQLLGLLADRLYSPSADQIWLMDEDCNGNAQSRRITFAASTSVLTLQATDALGFAQP